MGTSKTVNAAVIAISLLITAHASGQGSAITYRAAEGCPVEAEFAAEVATHLKTGAPELASPIDVDVFHATGGAVARVTYVDALGKTATRELSAATCAEVASAAALVTALAIEVLTREDSSPPLVDASLAPEDSRLAPSKDPIVDEPPAQKEEWARPSPSPSWELGAGVFAHSALAPDPLFGASAFVGLGTLPDWSVRAHVAASTNLVAERDQRSAEFQLITGRVEACALPLVEAPRVVVHPCAVVALGVVSTEGIETERSYATAERKPWGAAGPMLRAQATFLELVLDAQAGPWFPVLGSRRYVFEGSEGEISFHDVPPVGWFLAAHIGLVL